MGEMTKGPVRSRLFKLVTPMLLGLMAIYLFNIIDALYVGQLGVLPLAALSFTFPVVFTFISISIGLGVGASAVASYLLGDQKIEEMQRVGLHTLLLAFFLILILSILGIVFDEEIFRMMGARDEEMILIRPYMTLWFCGIPILVIGMQGNNLIRATGDMRSASIVMIAAAAGNAVMDPLFIFGLFGFPRLELLGAAVATVISWIFAFFVCMWFLFVQKKILSLRQWTIRGIGDSWRKVLRIALPAMTTNLLNPVSIGIVTAIIAEYGPEAVAAYGVGGRIESIALVLMYSTAAVLTPFIGQNYGAGLKERVSEAIRIATRFALVSQGLIYLLILFSARLIAGVFSHDPEVVEMVQLYLWIVPISYGFFGVLLVVAATYNGLQKPLPATLLNIVRLGGFYLPLGYFGGLIYGVPGVYTGLAAGNFLAGLIAFALAKRIEKRLG